MKYNFITSETFYELQESDSFEEIFYDDDEEDDYDEEEEEKYDLETKKASPRFAKSSKTQQSLFLAQDFVSFFAIDEESDEKSIDGVKSPNFLMSDAAIAEFVRLNSYYDEIDLNVNLEKVSWFLILKKSTLNV